MVVDAEIFVDSKKKHWEITKGIFSLVIWPGPVFDPRNGGGFKKFYQLSKSLYQKDNLKNEIKIFYDTDYDGIRFREV